MTSNNSIEASASAQLLDGGTVVVDRVAWERLNPDPTPDRVEDGWAYFGEYGVSQPSGMTLRVWNGDHWGDADAAEQAALDMLRAVAWARQEVSK